MTNKQKFTALVMFVVMIVLAAWLRTSYDSGRLVMGILWIIGSALVLVFIAALVANMNDIGTWLSSRPAWAKTFATNHWFTIAAIGAIIFIGYLLAPMAWGLAKGAVSLEDEFMAPVTATAAPAEPASMETTFRGRASKLIVKKGEPVRYTVTSGLQADFNRDTTVTTSWEEDHSTYKVRVISLKNGASIDSSEVLVCEYPSSVETATCTW